MFSQMSKKICRKNFIRTSLIADTSKLIQKRQPDDSAAMQSESILDDYWKILFDSNNMYDLDVTTEVVHQDDASLLEIYQTPLSDEEFLIDFDN